MSLEKDITNIKSMAEDRMTTYSSEILSKISSVEGLKRLDAWTLSNGSIGLFRFEKDGNAYEIEVRPIQSGEEKSLWGDRIKKREDRNTNKENV